MSAAFIKGNEKYRIYVGIAFNGSLMEHKKIK